MSFLRDRTVRYRRLADDADDKEVAELYWLLAEIDEQEADEIEKQENR